LILILDSELLAYEGVLKLFKGELGPAPTLLMLANISKEYRETLDTKVRDTIQMGHVPAGGPRNMVRRALAWRKKGRNQVNEAPSDAIPLGPASNLSTIPPSLNILK
jgi:hypothetical protein